MEISSNLRRSATFGGILIRRGYDICADETFDSPLANSLRSSLCTIHPSTTSGVRISYGPLDARTAIRHYMAGYEQPTMERVADLMRTGAAMNAEEQGFFHELFEQLTPLDCHEFMVSLDATPRQMAAFMRSAKVTRPIVVNWINHYSSDPNWRDDEMLTIIWGDRYVNVNGHSMLREDAEALENR